MNSIPIARPTPLGVSVIVMLIASMIVPRAAPIDFTAAGLHNISVADADALLNGVVIVRAVRNRDSLSLTASGNAADELRASVSKLNPNYLSEVIALVPASDTPLTNLAAALADVESYNGIPYFSKRQQAYYDLFDRITVERRTTGVNGGIVETRQHMEPFDDYRARYEYRLDATSSTSTLFFKATNLEPLIYYGGISAVAKGNMLWLLYAYRYEERLVYYGVGAFKAFDLFGLIRDRLETSLLGRVEAFFGFMKTQMNHDQ